MVLYFVGLGLGDEKDISIRGLEIVKKCDYVYLESYTSAMQRNLKELAAFYGKPVMEANRILVEQRAEEILKKAKEGNVAFLVVGDPFGATTHIDLRLRAQKEGINVKVIHNASIINAVGEIGLELYKYGKVTSIPFDNMKIASPYEVFLNNQKMGLHTLFLLDLDPSKNKFMSIIEGIDYLLKNGLDPKQTCVGIAGLGQEGQEIKTFSAAGAFKEHFTKRPQCLIVPGKLHFVEEEALKIWKAQLN
ncbi:MAG: diphthine synthase [Candidatus Woesearchaeota archaeon]